MNEVVLSLCNPNPFQWKVVVPTTTTGLHEIKLRLTSKSGKVISAGVIRRASSDDVYIYSINSSSSSSSSIISAMKTLED